MLAAFVPSLVTKNPYYLAWLLLVLAVTYRRLRSSQLAADGFEGWGALLKLGLLLAALAAVFTPLLVHAGATPLFSLPQLDLPWSRATGSAQAFGLGGVVTLESVVYGLATALGLMAILLTFATFHAAADPYGLLRSLPRFLVRSGVVLSIAVTFVPQMIVAQREVREAQALRGHRFRGLRDLAPLFVTLLSEGLERSTTLAESLEVRGFSRAAERPNRGAGLLLATSLLLLVSGGATRTWRPQSPWGNGLLVLGAGVLLLALLALGRGVQRTRLRPRGWRLGDTLLTATSLLSLTLLSWLWLTREGGLVYYPYPRAVPPELDLRALVALSLLAAPAFVATSRSGRPSSQNGGSGSRRGATPG